MRERLQEFSLSLHPEKTRLIEFGRLAADRPQAARARQTGDLQLLGLHLDLRQDSPGLIPDQTEDPTDRMRAKLKEIKGGIATAHAPGRSPNRGSGCKQVVTGYFNYHAVPTNCPSTADVPRPYHRPLAAHATAAQPEGSDDLGADAKLADDWLPQPRILHPWPNQRFAVTHPRWEPYAGKRLVRICAGGAQ